MALARERLHDSEAEEEEEEDTRETTRLQKYCRTEDDLLTVDEAIDQLGFGLFQILVSLFSGLIWLADAVEIMVLSVLSPALGCYWDLSSLEQALVTSIVFLGTVIGSFLWGPLCDRYGRRRIIAVANIIMVTFGILSAVPVSKEKHIGYPWLLLCRMGLGFTLGGTVQSSTYYIEFLPKKTRATCMLLLNLYWSIGSMFGAALALAIMPRLDWHWYLGLSVTPLVISLFFIPFVPESARFYVIRKRNEEAKKVIDFIAWINCKKPLKAKIISFEEKSQVNQRNADNIPSSEVTYSDDKQCDDKQPEVETVTAGAAVLQVTKVWNFFKPKIGVFVWIFTQGRWKLSLPLTLLWFGSAWIYYGLILMTTVLLQYDAHCGYTPANGNNSVCVELQQGDYLKIIWTAAAEFPGILLALLIVDRIGRKGTMVFAYLTIAVTFCLLFICAKTIVLTFFLFLIRAIIAGVFQVLYVYTSEVYPTSVRGTTLAFFVMVSKIGSITTPFASQVLLPTSDYLTISLYGFSGLILGISAIFLPLDTKGKPLTDLNINK